MGGRKADLIDPGGVGGADWMTVKKDEAIIGEGKRLESRDLTTTKERGRKEEVGQLPHSRWLRGEGGGPTSQFATPYSTNW